MMKYIHLIISLVALSLLSCNEEVEHLQGLNRNNDEIDFRASINEQAITKAQFTTLDTDLDIQIIAPGYGTGAPNQEIIYKADDGLLIPKNNEANPNGDKIKRSAENMYFSAWTFPEGVDIKKETVDFTKNLEEFIGAHYEEEGDINIEDTIQLNFSHLVAKVSINIYNIAPGEIEPFIKNAEIKFPSIRQLGKVNVGIEKHPSVSIGRSGDELKLAYKIDTGQDYFTFYMPPLDENELRMYGSFTIIVEGTSYVGTLHNISTGKIDAGHHLHLRFNINDDHTALLQAVTLAPWDEYPNNIYNRPAPGIWGKEDLQHLSDLVQRGENDSIADLYCDPNFPGQKIIRLYTDLAFTADDVFTPIGSVSSPFKDMIFDGNGYTISGITIENDEADNLGLFGVVENSTIKNIAVNSFSIKGNNNVGLLAGQLTGSSRIEHCAALNGNIMGFSGVGGLIGNIAGTNCEIINSYVKSRRALGNNNVGGFTGINNGSIYNSYVIMDEITCESNNAGGFAGANSKTIQNCYSSVRFSSSKITNCGAFVGDNNGSTGKNIYCYWNRECIDNVHCSKIFGDNTSVENGVEKLPSGSSGNKFDSGNGYLYNIYNNATHHLRNILNNNIGTLSKDDIYDRWAVTNNSKRLPVFSINRFE